MSSKSLDDLQPDVRALADTLLTLAYANDMHVTIIDTLRTPAEQQVKLAQGVSWTHNSLHEPQPPDGLARAIDIAPSELLTIKGWAPESSLWKQLGAWGKQVGFEWGGDWPHKVVNGRVVSSPDPSHFQLRHPVELRQA